jgi:hypothetical protein
MEGDGGRRDGGREGKGGGSVQRSAEACCRAASADDATPPPGSESLNQIDVVQCDHGRMSPKVCALPPERRLHDPGRPCRARLAGGQCGCG